MQHLAIIPDGNRRWAAQHKFESVFGHKKGMEVVQSAMRACIKHGVKYLSFYTFSLENFRRSELEKAYLFKLLADSFTEQLPDLIANGIKVCFVGDRSLFPDQLIDVIKTVEAQTQHLSQLTLNLLFCYGGRTEIVHAARALAQKVNDGEMDINAITEDSFRGALWAPEVPDPDLIIRTGGVIRLSNFLSYQAAYSEFMFFDFYWPEMTETKLEECIQQFDSIKRNFGS